MVELGSYTPTSTHLVVGAAFSMHGMGEFVAFFFFGGLVSVIITSLIFFSLSLSLSLFLFSLPYLPPQAPCWRNQSTSCMPIWVCFNWGTVN